MVNILAKSAIYARTRKFTESLISALFLAVFFDFREVVK